MKKKIIPLFWATFMIMLLIPANILVFAQGEETTAPEIESAIGKVVQMNESSLGSAYFYGTVTETTANGGSFRYYDNPNAVPSCFIVVDVVYNRNYDQYYYKLATVDGSTNEQLQKTPWLKAILCTVIGDAPQTLVGATANFKTATTIFYENVTESGASGSFGVASLPEKVVIIAEQTVDAACRADDLIQRLVRHDGCGIGQGVECVRTLFRLRSREGTLFTFRQGLAQQILEECAAVFRGIVGVDVGCGLIHDRAFDGVKVHRVTFLPGKVVPCLYIGLRIGGAVYDADFVYSADFRDGAFVPVFVPYLICNVEREGHLRQVTAPHGFVYAAALLGVGQFGTHFKAVVGDV